MTERQRLQATAQILEQNRLVLEAQRTLIEGEIADTTRYGEHYALIRLRDAIKKAIRANKWAYDEVMDTLDPLGDQYTCQPPPTGGMPGALDFSDPGQSGLIVIIGA